MSGRLIAERARERLPLLRVLYPSGYTSDVAVRNKLPDHRIVMIHEPFTPAALAGNVLEMLEAEPIE
jgi:hypothetical protein